MLSAAMLRPYDSRAVITARRTITAVHRVLYFIWVALLLGRGALLIALVACLIISKLVTGTAHAQTDVTRANREAYEAAMKCFVADGHAAGLRSRAGDPAKAKYYEGKAHLSFDAAIKLGAALGLPGAQINEDFGVAQARELAPMVTDQQYFLRAVGDCKALGLM